MPPCSKVCIELAQEAGVQVWLTVRGLAVTVIDWDRSQDLDKVEVLEWLRDERFARDALWEHHSIQQLTEAVMQVGKWFLVCC